MQLTLIKKDSINYCVLPEKKRGQYWLTEVNKDGIEENVISVEASEDKWMLISNKKVAIKDSYDEKVMELELKPLQFYNIFFAYNNEKALIYTEPITEDRKKFKKLIIKLGTKLTIGRNKSCDICFDNKLVSYNHAELSFTDENVSIKDLNSSNGTFVDGIKIQEKIIKPGSVIYILGLKIIIGKGFLAVNNPDGLVQYNERILKEFIMQKIEQAEDSEEDEIESDLFYRSPRFKRDIERTKIRIDSPPSLGNIDETPMMLILGPSLTMGMTSLFTGIVTLQSVLTTHGNIMTAMPTLMMSVSMMVGTVLFPILAKQYEKKKRKEREALRQKKYREYLSRVNQKIIDESVHQSKILYENNITVDECITRIKLRQRNLWERTYEHNDFLKVRLGIGSLPLEVDLSFSEKSFSLEDDDLKDELYKLIDKPKVLEQVPITISLLENWISGIIGDRSLVIEIVKGIIIQLSALHSYDELKFVFIYDKNEADIWNFARWLPHVWNTDKTVRYIAENQMEVKELSSNLTLELQKRKEMSNDTDKEIRAPYYMIFAISKQLAQKSEIVNMILNEKENYGFSLLTLYDELKYLPKECSTVIQIDNEQSKIYDKNDITGKHVDFHSDIFVRQSIYDIAADLANIQLDSLESAYSLPKMLTFLDMFSVSKIEHLNSLTRWKTNDPTKSLEIPLGVDTGGEAFNIDLHEKFHGPHGLIAGMTGSGKSELIMTLILSLAVNYHPYEVAFILIDYKGGGMANAFTKLPHLAGTITNLDGPAVKRSLVSIQSELKRRQSIFSKTSKKFNISNIDIYKYQKLYRNGMVKEPLQHLFIISDEFAELKTQQPDFMNELVSAARIGRSLGIHLILATQKPSGVVDDQIWSNTRFRICLKVQEKEDSMDVIKRPDAAELSVTGRFFMQVGFNEFFELGQSAWSGAPYYPMDQVEKEMDNSVSVIDNLGHVIRQKKIDRRRKLNSQNPPKQIDEINEYLAKLASEEHIKIRQLWLDPIPKVIGIEDVIKKYRIKKEKKYILNPVIGEIDDPSNQRQLAMTVPITEGGNILLYGAAGNGKTTFLTTMFYSLMNNHTPEELNIYILDFASETLKTFSKAPHVGDVILSHESEKVNNLFKMLKSEVEKRKKILAEYGGEFTSYLAKGIGEKEIIIVVIHNFSALIEMYDDIEDNIAYLTREGTKYGIYFIITSAGSSAVRYKISQNFKQIYVLQLNDDSDYTSILGNIDGLYPSKYKGRGIFKKDGVYEFQTAIVGTNPENIFENINNYCKEYNKNWKGICAKKVPILPEKIDIGYFKNELDSFSLCNMPIGVEKNSLKVSYYDFANSFISLILSENNDSISFIEALSGLIAENTKDKIDEIFVIDPLGMFAEAENMKYKYISKNIEETIIKLFEMLAYRNNTYKDADEKGEKLPEFEKVVCIITCMSTLIINLSPDCKDKLYVLLDNGNVKYNVNFIIADSPNNMTAYSHANWYKTKVSNNDGIWVGNGLANQFELKISNMSADLRMNIENNFGYVISKGKAKLVKLLLENSDEEGDIYG